jgi:hypothetical protein
VSSEGRGEIDAAPGEAEINHGGALFLDQLVEMCSLEATPWRFPNEAKELVASFEQRGTDRTGLGIGLTFSRWGAEANGGRLYARNLPGKGCVFTVDLPRSAVPAIVAV